MQLKAKSLEDLKTIIQRDYGVDLADEDANQLGSSLLKLSRLAITARDRIEQKCSMVKPIIN
jgi:hypothetical protein